MKVLVTGSGGYIGRHVVKALLDLGHQVVAADVRNDGVDSRAEIHTISVFEDIPDIYEKLGCPDVCIHMAWRNGFVHNAPSHMEDLSNHIRFLRYMMEGGLKNVAVMGTMHEVGYWEGAIDEKTPCNPQSMYGISKNAMRQCLMQMTAQMGVNLYWLRAYYILGDDTKNHSVFTKILEKDAEGAETFPFTSGKNLYDFIDVQTLAEYIAKASVQQEITGIINVCTGNPMSLADRMEQFIKEKNLKIRLDYGAFPDRPYDSPGTWGDATKIRQILKRAEGTGKKVLVTGVKGQLGFNVVEDLEKRGHIAIGVDIDEMDITDAEATRKVITEAAPDAVIHCAAFTAVDKAEDVPELCKKINVDGTENIAVVCEDLDIPMVYISTDYVFDGEGETPWKPDDATAPLNTYGLYKFGGEEAVRKHLNKYFIVRTSWVFGENGHNFINTMLRLGKERGEVGVVADQIGSPTYTRDLAVLLVDMIETEKYGIYHATNEGYCSWYEFTLEIFRQAGVEAKVNALTSEQYPVKAKRPHNSRLDKSKLTENGFNTLPTWQDALARYLANKLGV